MINKDIYSIEYINELKNKYRIDPQIIEKTIFAFGLLETLVISDLNFIFKGGTSLMFLLDKPYRLSTDIDIVVEPNEDIISKIANASSIYPFVRYEEDTRLGRNKIVKKHYKFFYKSLCDNTKEAPILLDVLFENNNYSKIIKKEIKNELIITLDDPVYVNLPSVECLLGDKLTAFAPKTIGVIPLTKNNKGSIIDKRIETIKQFCDAAFLFDHIIEFEDVYKSYVSVAKAELNYRGLNISYKDCLIDTFNASVCICSKGKLFKEDYANYLHGIKGINNYLINVNFNGEKAYIQGAKIMYLCMCLLTNNYIADVNRDYDLIIGKFNKLNYIKKIDQYHFNYIAAAIEMFENYIN